jgi:hypothetical protein
MKDKCRGDASIVIEEKLEYHLDSLAYYEYTADELRNNVTGVVLKKTIQRKLSPKKISGVIYFYFNKNEGSIDIEVGDRVGYVPLMPDKYGFNGERTQLNPRKIEGLSLNDTSRIKYNGLLSKCDASLPEILETVGDIVNSSMEYDFNRIIDKEKSSAMNKVNSSGCVSDWSDAKLRYVPTGDEVSLGICQDAGKQIRSILLNLGMDSKYKIKLVDSSKGGSIHDTTIVFNKDSGAWGIVNSKSPTKEFNLATRDQLQELGTPYCKD